MELKFYLKSKRPTNPEGTVSLRFLPVEGENTAFMADPTAEIVLDGITASSVENLTVPSAEELAGYKLDPDGQPIANHGIPIVFESEKKNYQSFMVTIAPA